MRRLLIPLAALTALAGCGSDLDELRQWMDQERKDAKPTVTPLLPPKKFLPQPYEAGAGIDPFSTQKLSVAIKQEAAQPNSLLTAEINRRVLAELSRTEQANLVDALEELIRDLKDAQRPLPS